MSARWIGRGLGVVITCNYDGCTERYQTANVVKKHNRAAAAREGWIRGGAKYHQRWDICPAHAAEELAQIEREAAEREERKKARDEARKAKFVNPLTRTCPACSAAPGAGCRVVKKGDSFAGGRPPTVTDRARKPHPERARAPAEAAA